MRSILWAACPVGIQEIPFNVALEICKRFLIRDAIKGDSYGPALVIRMGFGDILHFKNLKKPPHVVLGNCFGPYVVRKRGPLPLKP